MGDDWNVGYVKKAKSGKKSNLSCMFITENDGTQLYDVIKFIVEYDVASIVIQCLPIGCLTVDQLRCGCVYSLW